VRLQRMINMNNIEINVKKQQQKKYTLEGSIIPKKGHKIFEINEETGLIKQANYKIDTVSYNFMTKKQPKKLIINADCVYIPALNANNAKKRYLENNCQSYYFKKEPLLKFN